MLRTDVKDYLREQYQTKKSLYPAYGDYCFANIPGTAASIFDVDVGPSLPGDVFGDINPRAAHVVVILFDGLGWNRWQRDSENRFISTISEHGVVTPLTSIVPSATASAITTVHTARPVGDHGVLGRSTYLPAHERIVHSFSLSPRGNESGSKASSNAFPPSDLVTADPIYPQLQRANVSSTIIQPRSTLGTDYANTTFRGATQAPIEGSKEAAAALRRTLESATGPTYTYVYFPQIDIVTHRDGQNSKEYHQALADITRPLKRELCENLEAETAADTLVMVTADHGMIDLQPGTAGCLDLRTIEGLYSNIREVSGVPGIFGAQQMTHLLLEPGSRDEAITALRQEDVDVYTREEVRELELFGNGQVINQRLGDLLITHRNKKIIHKAAKSVIPTIGQHGGLSPDEMLIPFGVIHGPDLQNQ